MARIRELGVTPGKLPTGELNAITDVPGVLVGHVTLIQGEGALVPGEGPIRTGVTVVLPHGGNLFRDKVEAGVCAVNGFGKATGLNQIREVGTIETPIALTNTLNVARVADALIGYMLHENPDIGRTTGTVNPVVGECFDGFLNDSRGRHVHEQHVWQAIESASSGVVAEGNVGAGTGTACFQFKGGIGTASRRVDEFTVGALVQSNYGLRRELMMLGVPVGEHFNEELLPETPSGSIMMILATDAPLDSRQLNRLAMRGAFGLARTGSTCENQSGDFVIAFSTTRRTPHYPEAKVDGVSRILDSYLDSFFVAAVESIEEAILNSMTQAQTMTGRDGHTLHAVPLDRLAELFRQYRKL